jgi:hypothetical protein
MYVNETQILMVLLDVEKCLKYLDDTCVRFDLINNYLVIFLTLLFLKYLFLLFKVRLIVTGNLVSCFCYQNIFIAYNDHKAVSVKYQSEPTSSKGQSLSTNKVFMNNTLKFMEVCRVIVPRLK